MSVKKNSLKGINGKLLIILSLFLFLGGIVSTAGPTARNNLVEAAGPTIGGKYANICSNSYRTAWGFSQGTSGESCNEAYYLAFLGAQQACMVSLMNQSCSHANFCGPTGIPGITGVEYGPCAATHNPGEPSTYTASMYAFCNQKCG